MSLLKSWGFFVVCDDGQRVTLFYLCGLCYFRPLMPLLDSLHKNTRTTPPSPSPGKRGKQKTVAVLRRRGRRKRPLGTGRVGRARDGQP